MGAGFGPALGDGFRPALGDGFGPALGDGFRPAESAGALPTIYEMACNTTKYPGSAVPPIRHRASEL
jgi:hypothetical protein